MTAAVDTITAIATPPGRGGVGVIRISGPGAGVIAHTMLATSLTPRVAHHCVFSDENGHALDDGIALWFPSPNSFTGDDVLELQGHGGPVVMDLLLATTLRLGARLARPGEFSERAFLNGKIDLSQAEAIADLIDAASEAAVRGANRTLQGAFSDRVNALVAELIRLRIFVESSLDFPDEEDVGGIGAETLAEELDGLVALVEQLDAEATQGAVLREGIAIAILGAPNVGKSSLLNQLTGQERAIVTDIPGTTRDALRESLTIGDVPIQLVDTAGLRETDDPVESIGIERAKQAGAEADLILWVSDAANPGTTREAPLEDIQATPANVLVVGNKIDRSGHTPGRGEDGAVYVSAMTGAGIDALRAAITAFAGLPTDAEGLFVARRRHLDAIARAKAALMRAQQTLAVHPAIELAADDLRIAQDRLSEITGEFTSDDLLGEIFSSFCIGK